MTILTDTAKLTNISSLLFLIAFIVITGCASLPPGGENVELHMYSEAELRDCTELGLVSTSVSHPTRWDLIEAQEQALFNLQAEAFNQYGHLGANAVRVTRVYLSSARYTTNGEGIAYHCDKNNTIKSNSK